MSNIRRHERKGWVYVRGYRTDNRQTPFKEGFLLTVIDPNKNREEAIDEAIQRTNQALTNRSTTSPVIERIRIIRDFVLQSTKLKDLLSMEYIRRKLSCSEYELKNAVKRVLQLYPSINQTKLFNNFRYFYHDSLDPEDLHAAIKMKENYIRIVKGRANRVGHNWEAVAEWFINKFTTGASFRTQQHRNNKMDSRRITAQRS